MFYLSVILAFVPGAAVSTLLINAGKRRRIRSLYAVNILPETDLMALPGHAYLGLEFSYGSTECGGHDDLGARVRTTHVSGISPDIGIELSMWFGIPRSPELGGNAAP